MKASSTIRCAGSGWNLIGECCCESVGRPKFVVPATASEASEQRSWPEGRARSASKAGIQFDLVVVLISSSSRRPSPRRHPGEGRDPAPRSCGQPRSRDNRPTSLCFPRASLRAGHFLLLAQEKVTKEKGSPGAAPAARVRCGGRVPLTGHPWPAAESARSIAPTLRALSSALRRVTRAQDQETEQRSAPLSLSPFAFDLRAP